MSVLFNLFFWFLGSRQHKHGWRQLLYSLPPQPAQSPQQGGASLCNWHTSVSPPVFFHTTAPLAGCTSHSPRTGFSLVGHTSSSVSKGGSDQVWPRFSSLTFPFLLLLSPGSVWPTHTHKRMLMYSTCGYEDIWTGLVLAWIWLLHEIRGM